jgi:antitoxin YefM
MTPDKFKTTLIRWTIPHQICTLSCTYKLEVTMDAISYTTARANLAATMTKVCEDHEPLIITRSNADSVVMLSLADYKALEETAYLLRTPENARRLLTSIAELEAGGGVVRALAE